ncbi:MAG: hypothetical protein LBH77_08600, partial [Tannerella sp.]|nr:hypothetical protein [Tannerella sp.]
GRSLDFLVLFYQEKSTNPTLLSRKKYEPLNICNDGKGTEVKIRADRRGHKYGSIYKHILLQVIQIKVSLPDFFLRNRW